MSESNAPVALDRRGFCACALGVVGTISVSSLACGGGGGDSSSPAPSAPGQTLTPGVTVTLESKASMLAMPNNTSIHYGPSVSCPSSTGTPQGFYLMRDTTGIYAVDASCTHRGGLAAADAGGTGFTCPCHGSKFDNNGVVTHGPAAVNLKHYAVSEISAGGMLKVDTTSEVSVATRLS